MVTQDLFLAVTLIPLMHVMLVRLSENRGQMIHGIGLGVGVLSSIALAAVKFNTRLIISSHWNHYIYAVILILIVLVLLFTLLFGRKEKTNRRVGGTLLCIAGGAHGQVAGRAGFAVRLFAPAFPLRAVYKTLRDRSLHGERGAPVLCFLLLRPVLCALGKPGKMAEMARQI